MSKNALISPNESPVKYISGWTTTTPIEPIYTNIENSCRVAEVSDNEFEVALHLFWTSCADDVIADQYYYNVKDDNIYPLPPTPPYPNA